MYGNSMVAESPSFKDPKYTRPHREVGELDLNSDLTPPNTDFTLVTYCGGFGVIPDLCQGPLICV